MFDSALYLGPARDVKLEKRLDVCAQGKRSSKITLSHTQDQYKSIIFISRAARSLATPPHLRASVRVWLRYNEHCTCAQYNYISCLRIKSCESSTISSIAEPSSQKTLQIVPNVQENFKKWLAGMDIKQTD